MKGVKSIYQVEEIKEEKTFCQWGETKKRVNPENQWY